MEKKFILEIDEILFSLHQQDFYQLKSKVAAISGTLYERKAADEKWTKNITLGISVQSDENTSDNASRLLDLTITKAETINVCITLEHLYLIINYICLNRRFIRDGTLATRKIDCITMTSPRSM